MNVTVVLIVILVLIPGTCSAGGLSSFVGEDYREAVDTATEALMIQSGVKKIIKKKQKDALREIEEVAQDLGIREEVAIAGYLGKVILDKEISFQVNNLIVSKSKCRFSISQDRVELGIRFNFD